MASAIVENNIYKIVRILSEQIGFRHHKYLYNKMSKHPDFPSFLSFQHTLNKVGIESLAIHTTIEQLANGVPKPALTRITTNTDLFVFVNRIDELNVYYLNEALKEESMPLDLFKKVWDGNAFIFNAEQSSNLKLTFAQRIVDWYRNTKHLLIIVFLFTAFFYAVTLRYDSFTLFNWVFMGVYTLGIIFSLLLIVESIDSDNPLVKRFCGGSKDRSCSSILESKAAKFMGLLHWSDVGVLYFFTLGFSMLILPVKNSLSIAVLFAIIAFPYTFYSIFYQKYIAGSWCNLCLSVQLALTLNFLVAIWAYSAFELNYVFSVKSLPFIVVGLVLSALLMLIKPMMLENKIGIAREVLFRELKHTSGVRNALFQQSERKIRPLDSECIRISSNSAENAITLIISPTCQPCMRKLKVLIPLLKSKLSTCIELVLFVNPDRSSLEYKIARGVLVELIHNKKDLLDLLGDYADNFPNSRFNYSKVELDNLHIDELLENMGQWCFHNRVVSTPAVLINYAELPKYYEIEDIDYLCN